MIVIRINEKALSRVMNGQIGMTFIVDEFTDTIDDRGKIAHVRDYRYFNTFGRLYQIWSIDPEGYEVIE